MACEAAGNAPLEGDDRGGIPKPGGGGAIADVVGDRLEPEFEVLSGVGSMTPQDAETALPSLQGLAALLATASGWPMTVPDPPIPHTTPPSYVGVGAPRPGAVLQSTWTFPELEGM